MCKAKSFICIKDDPDPKWSSNHDSHTKLIKELGLKDDELHLRKFVKIEYYPENDNWFSPSDKWTFKVDEEGTLPAWFEEDRKLWEDRCWDVIKRKILPPIKCGIFPGDLSVSSNVTLPQLKNVGGGLIVHSKGKLNAPKLKTVNNCPYKS